MEKSKASVFRFLFLFFIWDGEFNLIFCWVIETSRENDFGVNRLNIGWYHTQQSSQGRDILRLDKAIWTAG